MADKALERKTGARGLRAIMESTMMDYMYRIPSDDSIKSLTITKDMVENNTLFVDKNDADIAEIEDQLAKKKASA